MRRILIKRRKIIRIVLCVWVPQLAMLTLLKKRHMRVEVRSSKMQNATTTYAAPLAEIQGRVITNLPNVSNFYKVDTNV